MNKRKLILIAVALIAVVAIGLILLTMQKKPGAGLSKLPSQITYAAIGDSVAAGDGLVIDLNTQCRVSSQGYPTLLTNQLNTVDRTAKLQNVSCSGATTGDISGNNGGQYGGNGQLGAAFANQVPDLVTMTIGANDIDWIRIITQCATSTCGSATDTTKVDQSLATFKANLTSILANMNELRGSKSVKVIVTGYYSPFDSISCINLGGRVSPSNVAWLKAQTVKLNTTIQAATSSYDGAVFAPIDFSGHGICDAEPWIQSINDAAPFHPTKEGQAAMAKQIFSLI